MTKEAYFKQQWEKSLLLNSEIIGKLDLARITPKMEETYYQLLSEFIKTRDEDMAKQISSRLYQVLKENKPKNSRP